MSRVKLTAVIWEEEGVFVSKCPEIEVASAGDTPQEALMNLQEAIELWITNIKELGILDEYDLVLKSPQRFTSTIEMNI
ncbi:MAG: type II toxin-antitoxin system HicB family antitoxin [Candidatus Hodarchaeales archaeon]